VAAYQRGGTYVVHGTGRKVMAATPTATAGEEIAWRRGQQANERTSEVKNSNDHDGLYLSNYLTFNTKRQSERVLEWWRRVRYSCDGAIVWE